MINRYQPHVLVLPEDDADSQLANGFLLSLDQAGLTKIQVLPEVGGWLAVLDAFESITSRQWIVTRSASWSS